MGVFYFPVVAHQKIERGGERLNKLIGTLTSKQGPIISYNFQFKRKKRDYTRKYDFRKYNSNSNTNSRNINQWMSIL
jgi:hypothetical protein